MESCSTAYITTRKFWFPRVKRQSLGNGVLYYAIETTGLAHTNFIVISYYGKTRVTSYELRDESLKAQVEIQKCEFESMSYEFESTSYEFESTSYEFESTSYEFQSTSYDFESTSSRIIKNSMKTQVSRVLKSSSFPKIIGPKLFGNSWGFWWKFFVLRFHYSMATAELVNINFETSFETI